MAKKNNNNSGLPLIIIGLVLLGAIIGGWWLYSSSNTKTTSRTNTNKNTSQPTNTPDMTKASVGAQPPQFKGAQNASVLVEEFADFQCGSCAALHPIMNEINSAYGSKIKFVYRNFPLIQIHPKAYDAAVAAEAAGFQGQFWQMQNLLFRNQQAWAAAPDHQKMFDEYAQSIGLNMEQYKGDVAGMRAKQRVDADLQRGRSMNITQTPTLYVNGKSIPYEQMTVQNLKQVIDAELQKAPNSGQDLPDSQPTGNTTTENK